MGTSRSTKINWEARVKSDDAANIGTLGQLGALWLEELREKDVRSLVERESVFNSRINVDLGHVLLAELRREHVEAWFLELKSVDKWKRKTLWKFAGELSAVCQFGVRKRVLEYNPVRDADKSVLGPRKRTIKRELEILSLSEIRKIVSSRYIPLPRRALYATLLLTGMRLGEAVGLQWGDVHLRRPLNGLGLVRQYHFKTHRLRETKTDTENVIPIHPVLNNILQDQKAWFRLHFKRPPEAEDPLLPAYNSKREPRRAPDSTALTKWKQDLVLIGLNPRTLHSTRHTFCTQLKDAGANLLDISAMVHPSTEEGGQLTLPLYSHSSFAAKCRAILMLRV